MVKKVAAKAEPKNPFNDLLTVRQMLLDLLDRLGDFRPESRTIGECKLALVAIEYSHNEKHHEKDRIDVLAAAHRALFNAKGE